MFDQDGYFDVIESTVNGTWITGNPLKSGIVQIRATLIGTRSESGSISALPVPLTATATMEIFDQIDLQPKLSSQFKIQIFFLLLSFNVIIGSSLDLNFSLAFRWE
jgi:hypothetical protein